MAMLAPSRNEGLSPGVEYLIHLNNEEEKEPQLLFSILRAAASFNFSSMRDALLSLTQH